MDITSGTKISKRIQRLRNESELLINKGKKDGFSCQPLDSEFIQWHGFVFNTFDGNLGTDLMEYESRFGQDHILIELTVGEHYPLTAPIVRVISPRFKPFSGNVDVGGIFHSNLLTQKGWTPVATLQAVIEDFKTNLLVSEARLELDDISLYEPEEALAVQQGFYSTFVSAEPSESFNGSMSGKVLLPSSALHRIVSLPSVQFPLIFELSDSLKHKKTHVGAIFDSDKEQIVIPPWVMTTLGSSYGDPILVRLVSLPKGKIVRLSPEDQSFHQLEDPNYILESVLRTFTVLTQGETIQFTFNDKLYRFHVLETYPGPAIDINDTDLEVDLLVLDSEERKIVEEKPKPIVEKGNELGQLHPSTHGEMKTCSHCERPVPIDSILRHEAFCQRNNTKCPNCNQMILKGLLQQHIIDVHEKVTCACGEEIEKSMLGKHKESACHLRLITCEYCHLKFSFKEKESHEEVCGSRTDNCPICQKPTRLKEMDHHRKRCERRAQRKANKQANPKPKPAPSPPPPEPSFTDSIVKFFSGWS